MNPMDDKQVFFDMQEHPERYSDEQLEAMMTELDREPDAEEAWQKTLSNSPLKGEDKKLPFQGNSHFSLFTFHFSLRRAAAVFIAAAFLGGLHPLGAIFSSFFIQHITDGGQYVNTNFYSSQISDVISSVIIYLCSFVLFIKLTMKKILAKKEEKKGAK